MKGLFTFLSISIYKRNSCFLDFDKTIQTFIVLVYPDGYKIQGFILAFSIHKNIYLDCCNLQELIKILKSEERVFKSLGGTYNLKEIVLKWADISNAKEKV